MEKYTIKKNTVQETLVIPLYARKICMDKFPEDFEDRYCQDLLNRIETDFKLKKIPLYGALEAGMRQFDLCTEIRMYLKDHPNACVINMGCGLDTTFSIVDNGTIKGYNLDRPDVIEIRNEMLPPINDREKNISCDLNDIESWKSKLDYNEEDGIVLIGGGLFYYFKREEVKSLFCKLANSFKGGKIVFDITNAKGLKMMQKMIIRNKANIDVRVYFSVENAEKELTPWCENFKKVTRNGYMTGYRKPDKKWGFLNRRLAYFFDRHKYSQIIAIEFK